MSMQIIDGALANFIILLSMLTALCNLCVLNSPFHTLLLPSSSQKVGAPLIIFISMQGVRDKVIQKYGEMYRQKYKKQLAEEGCHTILASFVVEKLETKEVFVMSMATGTKSLPFEIVQKHDRDVLRDMHAEVLARRAFLKFVKKYAQNTEIVPQLSDLFEMDKKRNKFRLNTQKYQLILYTSELPCGAAMIDKQKSLFSGAKPLSHFQLSYQHEQQSIYDANILRTKPGRLDLPRNKRSCSLSCTDKIMNWCLLGIQGNKLFKQYLPIYIDRIIVQSDNHPKINKIRECIDIRQRLSKILDRKVQTIERKLLHVIIDGKQMPFTKQFKFKIPAIDILPKKFNKNNILKAQTSLIYAFDGYLQQINAHTGLKHGGSLKHILKNQSTLSSSILLDHIPTDNTHYQYTALKDRMKKLFGEWTTDYKKWRK